MTAPLSFTFEGLPVTARAGQSLAAALTEAGHRRLRATEQGRARGLFCGMGVCQDCLVTVDGNPNMRACMTPVVDGMDVVSQPARPDLVAPPDPALGAERRSPDILVIGGGAGGLSAAIAAREAGADVLLIDDRKHPGGQYYKQTALPGAPDLDAQQRAGRALVTAARRAGVEILGDTEVWGAFPGREIMAVSQSVVYAFTPGAVIVATGAYERPAMVPGWTLPGVMTVGAAQTLWRSHATLPGRRVALFGNGPLTAQVALELAQGGAEITCLGEAAPPPLGRVGAALAMLRHDPALARKGLGMLAALAARGIRVHHAARLLDVAEADGGLRVRYRAGRRDCAVMADAVCMNMGFQPQNEILRLLGARMVFDPRFEQLRPVRTVTCETSVARVFAVGDCAGLGGAPAAVEEGRIAGHAAATDTAPTRAARDRLARHRAFQSALWSHYRAPAERMEDLPAETVICRCEEVTKATLETALETGVSDIGAVKRATRIGMGRCQGRYCGPALAGMMARRSASRVEDLSFFAPRVPIKPVRIATLVAAERLLSNAPRDDSAA